MKIKKNDQIIVISGKDRGKKGKVLRVFPKEGKVLVEGMNIKKKHSRPKKSGEKGEVLSLSRPFDASNVKVICPKCSQPARIGYKLTEKNKFRICKKCKQEFN